MQDLLQLLFLIIAIAIGWWLGRRNTHQSAPPSAFNADYYRGLNYLLNHKTDEALAVFIDSLEVNNQNLETHLALGNAFRRKGEVDKAIHIHQNLLNQPSLTHTQLSQAQLELAHDFVKSGLLDRAEKLLMESAAFSPDKSAWGTLLLDIYQREQDWHKALSVEDKFHLSEIPLLAERLSHFACEQALLLLKDGNEKGASELLSKANAYKKSNPRIDIIQAKVASAQENYILAKHHLLNAIQQDPELIPLVLMELSQCFYALDDLSGWNQWLDSAIAQHPSTSVVLAKSELIKQTSPQEAVDFVTHQLIKRPSVKGFDYLIGLHSKWEAERAQESLVGLQGLTSALVKSKASYRCKNCGYASNSLQWQCPTCSHWGTTKPLFGLRGE